MRVFVTGATGHIGAWLVAELEQKGYEIVAGVRNPEKARFLESNLCSTASCDLSDVNTLAQAMKGCDMVFHLAAFAAVWSKDPSLFERTNTEGTENVLKAATMAQVKRVLICSSAGNFGPSREGVVTENTKRKLPFFNAYERTKAAADEIALRFLPSPEIVIVYPTRVYGPVKQGEAASLTLLISRIVNDHFRWIPTLGNKIGNYVYVQDVALGMIAAAERGRSGEKYILGGENTTLTQLYHAVRKEAGLKLRFFHIPMFIIRFILFLQYIGTLVGRKPRLTKDWLAKIVYDYKVSAEKAENELGYKSISLKDGLHRTIYWLRTTK